MKREMGTYIFSWCGLLGVPLALLLCVPGLVELWGSGPGAQTRCTLSQSASALLLSSALTGCLAPVPFYKCGAKASTAFSTASGAVVAGAWACDTWLRQVAGSHEQHCVLAALAITAASRA